MAQARQIAATLATPVTLGGNGVAPARMSPTVLRLEPRRCVPAGEPVQIGHYRIVRRIAAGGMGIVYEAVHASLGRRVAIKLLRSSLIGDPEVARRFMGEALAGDRIRHEGVTKVYDFGQLADGTAYLIMEYLSGHTLAESIANGESISLRQAVTIARAIAATMAKAHAAGVIHRDLKPDNVFLATDPDTDRRRVKVLDFGVAKLDGESRLAQTGLGHVLGTPWYMPPEQCRAAGEVDGRADIYALGCMLFEMVCGQVPFPGKLMDVLDAHERLSPPFPRTINPAVPRPLQSLILQMLAKAPEARPQTMTEVAQRLTDIARGAETAPPVEPAASAAPVVARTHGRIGRARAIAAVAVAMVALAGATAAISSVL